MIRDVKHAPIWPILLLFVIYPFVLPSALRTEPREGLGARDLARAVSEHFTLRINDVVRDAGELPGRIQVEGEQYAPGPPGLALLTLPPLLLAKLASWAIGFELTNPRALRYLRIVVSIVPTCLAALAFFLFLARRNVHAHAARFAVLAYALCAPIWVYATGLSGAHLAGVCLLLCLALLAGDEDWPSQASFAIAGVLAALAVTLAYLALPLVLLVAIYAFTRARSPQWALGFLMPVVLGVCAVCAYHWYTTQTIVTVIDGSGGSALWGLHAPKGGAMQRLFFSELGLLRLAPIFAVAPLGLIFMVGRGDVGEAVLMGSGITLVLVFASGDPGVSEPVFGSALLPLALALAVWPLARVAEAVGSVAVGSFALGILACWSLIQSSVLVATHVFVPSGYANPLRDLSVAMLRDGIYERTLAHAIGLHGDMAIAPLFVLVFCAACALSLGGAPLEEDSGWRRVFAAILFGAAAFYWQLSWTPEPHRRERYLDTLAIELEKEAARDPDARIVRRAERLERAQPGSREAKLARGHAATAFGDNAAALDQYRTLP